MTIFGDRLHYAAGASVTPHNAICDDCFLVSKRERLGSEREEAFLPHRINTCNYKHEVRRQEKKREGKRKKLISTSPFCPTAEEGKERRRKILSSFPPFFVSLCLPHGSLRYTVRRYNNYGGVSVFSFRPKHFPFILSFLSVRQLDGDGRGGGGRRGQQKSDQPCKSRSPPRPTQQFGGNRRRSGS